MPAPGFLSDVVLWPWFLPYGEARTVTLDFVDGNGDPTDPGVVTVDAGAAWNVHATVTGTGSSRTVTWSSAKTVALADGGILGGKWRLRIDGVYKMGGPIRSSSPTAAPTAGEWTVGLPSENGTLTVTITGGGSSGGGGGGTVDHEVVLFATDVDMSGGSWTDLPNYSGGTIPRAYLAGVTVLVVAGGDLGLWTITASGPCTPGAALAPGESIGCTAGGTGWFARTDSADNTTVSGVTVMAKDSQVRSLSTTVGTLSTGFDTLSGTVGTQGATLDTLDHSVESLHLVDGEAANGLDMLTTAAVTTPPPAWAECGWGNTVGDQERGYWRCTTLLPRPTTSSFTVFTARSLSGSTEETDLFQELGSECLDSGGVPGAGGNYDLTEFALRHRNGRLSTYYEWSAFGALIEWQPSQDPQVPAPEGFGVPPKTWVTVAKAVPDFSTGTILMLALSDHGTYIDPWLNLRWKVLQTYEMGEPYSLAESNGVEQWRGRGGGRFDIARARYFYDDVEVSDFDGLMGANGGTTITDRVLLDGNGDPAVWEAQVNAVNVNND